mmetsp:Transcript_33505/g.88539  ORF Transcript_33505/g.88539 Transcript_33505/m.88539 type:complete len:91 (-) Transcript_33505:425-697(-)
MCGMALPRTEPRTATNAGGGGGGGGGSGRWPELVGTSGASAVACIQAERPDLKKVMVVPHDAMVTMDVRMDRVRVFVDGNGGVCRPPKVG